MRRTGALKTPVVAVLVVLALGVGALAGWVLKPAAAPRAGDPFMPVLDQVDEAEKRSRAVVEILDDMAAGRVSRDPDALGTLRDSMQEIAELVGDIASQLKALQRRGR